MTDPSPSPEGAMATRDRILDAALDAVRDGGLSRLTLDDVAHRADVSRQTIYRHFKRRDGLVEAAVVREEEALLARVRTASDTADSLHDALRIAVSALYRAARDHPLLDRLLVEEPGEILPFIIGGPSIVLRAARQTVVDILRRFHPNMTDEQILLVADIVTRLSVSFVIAPSQTFPIETVADRVADLVVAHLETSLPGTDSLAASRR